MKNIPHFGKIYQSLLESSKMTPVQVCKKMGWSRSKVYQLKDKPTVDMETIDDVCRLFQVTPMIFFDRELLKYGVPTTKSEYNNLAVIGQATMNIGLSDEVKYLHDILAEKERFIQYLLKGVENTDIRP